MGGKAKKQTIGYKYYVGMHHVLCQGPIEKITEIKVDDRLVWSGVGTDGQITISAEEVFGGKTREGGISGPVDIEMGGLTQGQNDYLVTHLGAEVPAHRGVAGTVLRDVYCGNNSYLKAWKYRAKRIHIRQEGILQWYDEKSEIFEVAPTTEGTQIRVEWLSASVAFPGSGYFIEPDIGHTIFDHHTDPTSSRYTVVVPFEYIDFFWKDPLVTQEIDLRLQFRRKTVSSAMRARLKIKQPGDDDFTVLFPKAGSQTTADGDGWFDIRGLWPDNWFFDIEGPTSPDGDMNPSHIIRECLTDLDWGMGYSEDDIDDTSFSAAADTLFDEGLGMSLLWDKQIKIEDFVTEVVKHIDAALYVSRSTGKFILKLIRDDYNPDALLELDESNIDKVTGPSRTAFDELANSVTVNYWNKATGKDASLTVTDTAMVQQQGVTINTTVQYPGFTNSRNASLVGQRDLKALSSSIFSCTIYADETAKNLNIGDVFKFSWAKWYISGMIMRITGIAFGNGRKNQVRITCTQDIFATPDTTVVDSAPGEWLDPSAPPTRLLDQLSVEAPYFELIQFLGQTATDTELTANPETGFILASAKRRGSAINARMWTDSGSGYEDVTEIDFCPTAELTTAITKVQTSFTVAEGVNLAEVELGSHVQVGDELMRVDSLDTTTGAMTVGRGVLDTVPAEHAEGDVLFFWDAYAGFDETDYALGETVGVKLLPVSGSGVLDIGDAVEMLVTLDQRAFRPYAPGDLKVNGDSYLDNVYQDTLTITWTHRDRIQQTSGTLIDHTEASIGPEAGTLYRLQGYVDDVLTYTDDDISGTTVDWTPSDEGVVKVEIHAKRDGIYSWQAPSHEFYYSGGGARSTEEGDERRTEEGILRVTED